MSLTIQGISEVKELFSERNWEIDDDALRFASVFNRFCARLNLFEEEGQRLLIKLSYKFSNIGINDYQRLFIDGIKLVPNIDQYRSIVVVPLKAPSITKIKSSDSLWYHLKKSDFSYERFGAKLYFESDWTNINKIKNKNILLILIDDFIGTGETVITAVDEHYLLGNIDESKFVNVLSLLAQVEGIEMINSKYGNLAICANQLKKGISDNYIGEELRNTQELMAVMEKQLKVRADFSFGYGKSESLVAISNRSPNNTFPVFWLETKKKLAPFKR